MIGYITIVLAAVYAVYLIRLSWSIPPLTHVSGTSSSPEKITVIVPFRNEEEVLGELLYCLEKQDFDGTWEIILADDHSDDNSSRMALEWSQKHQRAVYLRISGTGKKQAIREAVGRSTGQIIVTLDADTRVGHQWLNSVSAAFEKESAEMIVLPVMLDNAKNFIGKMEQLEFLSVSGVTAGAIGMGRPVMCNGANLAFRKSSYQKIGSLHIREDLASGDDMFLLISIARRNADHVKYLSDPAAIARTSVLGNPMKIFRQRVRWASKISAMNYQPIMIAGAIVGLFHLALVLCLISGSNLWFCAMAWLTKAICDLIIVSRMNNLFRIHFRPDVFIMLELLHPFYSIVVPLVGIVWKPSWKGRMITTKAV